MFQAFVNEQWIDTTIQTGDCLTFAHEDVSVVRAGRRLYFRNHRNDEVETLDAPMTNWQRNMLAFLIANVCHRPFCFNGTNGFEFLDQLSPLQGLTTMQPRLDITDLTYKDRLIMRNNRLQILRNGKPLLLYHSGEVGNTVGFQDEILFKKDTLLPESFDAFCVFLANTGRLFPKIQENRSVCEFGGIPERRKGIRLRDYIEKHR